MSLEKRHIYADAGTLARAAAVRLLEEAQHNVAERGIFTLALAGGTTDPSAQAPIAPNSVHRPITRVRKVPICGDSRKCRRRDSNPRHADYDSAALTD